MSVLSPFIHLLEKEPGRVLFESDQGQLSVADLFRQANGVREALKDAGVNSGDRVAVILPRDLEAVVSVFGILLAGACYVPIDVASPQERIQFILNDSGAVCLISTEQVSAKLDKSHITFLDSGFIKQAGTSDLSDAKVSPVDSESLAALLYTSGSTGVPKGVAVSHRAIQAFCHWAIATFSITDSDRIASLTPFYFDLSLFDLFAGPSQGATTLFVPDKFKLSPARLVDWLIDQRITTWYTVPSMLSFVGLKGGLDTKTLPDLRLLLFAGEVFPTPALINLTGKLPDTDFYNLFGPTETNVCLSWQVDRDKLVADKSIPVGRPACAAEVAVQPDTSELLVRGPCLMSGYWTNGGPVLKLDSSGWFHTGDKVSVNAEGLYEYHGRLDRMIKSAGYRIEPAEIEQVLNAIAGVKTSVVLGITDAVAGSRLVAVVAGDALEQRILRQEVNRCLPAYLRPGQYFVLDDLPRLPNGKTNLQQIQKYVEQELS